MGQALLELRVRDSPVLARWCGVAIGVALVALGQVADERPITFLGAATAVVFAVLLAPESILTLFMFAGAIKGTPGFSAAPVDLTALAAVLVVATILVVSFRSGLGPAPMMSAFWVAIALAGLILLSVFWAPDQHEALSKALKFEVFNLLAIFAPIILIRSRASLTRFAISVAAFAVFVALNAVTTSDPSQPTIIAGGDEIELGTYSAVGVVVLIVYLSRRGSLLQRGVALAVAVYLLHTVLLSGSRGALVSTVVALFFFVLAGLSISSRNVKIALVALAIVAVLAIRLPALTGGATAKYKDSLFTSKTSSVVGSRGYLLQEGWDIAVAHPFGIGAAGFDVRTNGLGWPHNIFLELADEQGIMGVGLFVVLVLLGWRARRYAPGGAQSQEAVFAGSLILLFLVEANFSNDLDGNRPVWLALGIALALSGFRPELESQTLYSETL